MRSLWGFAAPIIWGILPASSGIVLLFATMSQVFSDAAQLAVTVCAASGGGISGGISMLFALPAYKQGVGVPAPQTKDGGRGVPDVAAMPILTAAIVSSPAARPGSSAGPAP
jgi:hypothetical protein